jgi:cell division protein FtsQ
MSALAHAIARVRPGARRRTRARREWRRPLAIAALAALVLALAYWFWFRDSGLVAVSKVEVRGIPAGSPGAAKLERVLERAGKQMTTLHVQTTLLERAASPFPLVRSVTADPGFPHTLSVRVFERRPAALIGSGSKAAVVASDGLVIRSLSPDGLDLPSLPLREPPKHARLRGTVLEQARVLGAVPRALQPYLESSRYDSADGVVVVLRGGIELRFGSPARAARKWRAAAAVIADPSLTALDYVDLSSPQRPAVGGAGHILP